MVTFARMDVPALNLATRAIRVNAAGQLGSDKAQAKISVNSTDLHELRPALAALSPGTRIPVLLEGRASYNGSIFGKLDALSTHGRLELENFDTELAPLQISAQPARPGKKEKEERIHWDSLVGDLSYSPVLSVCSTVPCDAAKRLWIFPSALHCIKASLMIT